MAGVTIKNLTKRFDKVVAVDQLNLEVKNGEFVCILGPSGCGKTTTLRMIAGLEKQDEGDVFIGDKVVNDLSPTERDIAMVFQFYAIYPGMTVYDNLAFPLKQSKMPKNEIRKQVKETSAMLRIDHILDKDAMSLTAGEKQRIALGRAYVRNPQVFLLDEPLTNLDAGLRAMMRVELKRLQKEVGQTTIYVTHDQLEGMTMADRIAVMKLGLLQQYDNADNLFNKPNNLFVAGFVGTPTMNFIECSYGEKRGSALLEFDGFSLNVNKFKGIIKERMTGEEMTLGIRPTEISLHKQKGKDGNIEGTVEVLEMAGDQIIVDLAVGKETLKAMTPRTAKFDYGEKVWVKLDMNRIHIFDKKTEEAII